MGSLYSGQAIGGGKSITTRHQDTKFENIQDYSALVSCGKILLNELAQGSDGLN